MKRILLNLFYFIVIVFIRTLVSLLGWLANILAYKRLSKSLVVNRFTKKLNMNLSYCQVYRIRNALNDDMRIELLVNDFSEALDKLEANQEYSVSVNNGVYALLRRKLRSQNKFKIEVIKEKITKQIFERGIIMKLSTLFKTLVLMQDEEKERLLYKNVKVLDLKIIKVK